MHDVNSRSRAAGRARPGGFAVLGLWFVTGVQAQQPAPDEAGGALEEVQVTAQRRAQSIVEVPFSISAVDGDTLDSLGALRFEDFARTLPGVAFSNVGPGQNRITIRGVSTFSGVSVVGLYIDESPVASTINFTQPSFTLFDLERIEVVRGPQGTLFGEGSLGGTIRYITAKPDLERFGVRAATSLSQTEEGGTNYDVNALLNAPVIEDRFAVRLTGTHQTDSGYIDNLPLGQDDWNDVETDAARAKALWKVSDRLSIELSGLYQTIAQDGPSVESFDRPDESLENNDTANQNFDDDISQAALVMSYELPALTLTSATSYFERKVDQGAQSRGPAGTGTPRYTLLDADFDVLTEELRAVSSSAGRLQWSAGLFYKEYEVDELRRTFAGSPSGAPLGAPSVRESSFDQTALFGELEYGFTPRLFGTVGVRWFSEDQEAINDIGQRFPVDAEEVVPRAALRFELTQDASIYASYSEGFRSGGVNLFAIPGVDNTYDPDRTDNYELGTKLWLAGRRVGLNAAVYHIKWNDLQTFVARPDLGPFVFFVQNVASAEVDGAELEVSVLASDGFELGATGSYTDARYTADAPFEGPSGNQLPKVPEWTASGYAQYRTALGSKGWEGYGRFDYQYYGTFPELGNNLDWSGNYRLGNLRAGVDSGRWQLEVFVNNLWDERADLFQRRSTEFGMYRNRPRTYGMTARWSL